MNARCSPVWVVRLHATNQLADLCADLRPSGVAQPRPPSPEQPEAGAMPGYNRLRLHQYQCPGPSRPQRAQRNPEQSIEAAQFGTALFPLEHSKLLPKCNRFQREFVAGHQKGTDVCEYRPSEHNHQSMLINGISGRRRSGAKRLIPFASSVLMTHKEPCHPYLYPTRRLA